MGVGIQRHGPAALPPVKTRYPLYRRRGGPQGRFGRVRKISPPPGFDPRTVQPVGIVIPNELPLLTWYICMSHNKTVGVYEKLISTRLHGVTL